MTKKVPCISPIIHDNNFFSVKKPVSLIIIFVFLTKQCSVIENNSALPLLTNPITDQYLLNIEFTKDDIKIIICKLDPNKDMYLHVKNVWRQCN